MLTAINRTLEESMLSIERSHLSNTDIYRLEGFAHGFATRVKTYNLLRDNAGAIVDRTLQFLSQAHPTLMAKHSARCKYDMSEVLRYMALAILRDDERFFSEQMMDWLSTVLHSYQVTKECAMAYRKMHETIERLLPPECAILTKPYFDVVLTLLERAK